MKNKWNVKNKNQSQYINLMVNIKKSKTEIVNML